MVDSVDLLGVAEDAGFLRRVEYFMSKRAAEIIADPTPDANELSLAKILLFPANTHTASADGVIRSFAVGLVTQPAVAAGLVAVSFQHTQVSDATIESGVDSFWVEYAKSVV